jgi:outer membrane PBP1 activator LpoA protein
MRIKSVKAWCAAGYLGLMFLFGLFLSGCSTVCLEPDGLCAPGRTNTSAHPRVDELSYGRQAPRAPAPAPAPVRPPETAAPVETRPIELPGREAAAAGAARIALLLPMQSSTLGSAAEAVRAGFMASVDRDGAGFQVDLISTSDNAADALDAYARAAVNHDIIVGPLARPAVSALAAGGPLAKPTVALNHPENRAEARGPLPRRMWIAGLSLEDEARQVAEWAARQHPHGRVLILTGNAPWAQRAAAAFEARWNELGQTSQRFAVASNDGQVEPGLLDGLKNRLDIDTPELLFAALDVPELRQVRARIGTTLPCYGGGSINPGRSSGMGIAELDGIHVVDLPWLVLPDHPAVMVYPRPAETEQPLYMQRLYALGIDAFLVARELALHPDAPSAIDGVSGRLTLDPAGQALRRVEATAVYHDGSFNPVNTEP